MPLTNLVSVKSREELYPLYQKEYSNQKSNIVIGQQVGQLTRFLHEIKAGNLMRLNSHYSFFKYGTITLR